jgi:hypothetical protein
VTSHGNWACLVLARSIRGHRSSQIFSSSFLSSPSKCRGYTRDREDSSESVFLLIENYNSLTAPTGLRIGWEFLYTNIANWRFCHKSTELADCLFIKSFRLACGKLKRIQLCKHFFIVFIVFNFYDPSSILLLLSCHDC